VGAGRTRSSAGRGRRGPTDAHPTHRCDLAWSDCGPPEKETVITAIAAAVLFAVALVLHLAHLSLGPLDEGAFLLAGLLLVALYLAGVGTARTGRARRR
jgi:hypothetical protein